MTLEIPGPENKYSFIIDKEPDYASTNGKSPQEVMGYFNKQGKGLITYPELYAFYAFSKDILENNGDLEVKVECEQLLNKIRADFTNPVKYFMLGSFMQTKKDPENFNRNSKIIHYGKSKVAIPEEGWLNIPFYKGDISDIMVSDDGLKFMQAMISKNDDRKTIEENIKFGTNSKIVPMKTPPEFRRDELDYYQVLVSENTFMIYFDTTRCCGSARGVKYINK